MTDSLVIGIDIGGTFTDVVARGSDGRSWHLKVPSTRGAPARAVAAGIDALAQETGLSRRAIRRFVHGTTVATNAVLERKGARVGLITTRGFRDVLEIGKQARRQIYDVVVPRQTPVFLAPRWLRREVGERVAADGSVVEMLDEAAVRRELTDLVAAGVEALAVSFLFAFANPAHERRVREIAAAAHPQLFVSLSSDVDPAFREYERTAVTAFDAYVKPVLDRYLGEMECDLEAGGVAAPLQIMQSRGGVFSSRIARERPVRLFLSGPAAGVVGGRDTGIAEGIRDLVTLDIGGTSCDVALISDGVPLVRAEGLVDGFPVRVPMVDVNSIGAGGGSIAWLDSSGALRVGPQSAGAEPGPACYGRGGEAPTVTDASIVLGYIGPLYFAGGSLHLDTARAHEAIERVIAKPLGLSVVAAALGIHRVINAQMAEAIRLVSIHRGFDPRGFTLVPLGGAGPLHATALARELSMTRILVPERPGVLSAAGLLAAPIEHEIFAGYAKRLDAAEPGEIRRQLAEFDMRVAAMMAREGIAADEIHHSADMCFVGQSYYLDVPIADAAAPDMLDALYEAFLKLHDRIYGHSQRGAPAALVNLRAVHRAAAPAFAERPRAAAPRGAPADKGARRILTGDIPTGETARVCDRASLGPGMVLEGPAILEQTDTTVLVERGWRATVTERGSLLIEQT